jgi:hypothetical protein
LPGNEGVAGEHANGVPDREFTLIRSRSLNRTSTFRFTIARIIIAGSAPVLAAAAIAAGSGITGGGASAQPVRPAAARTAQAANVRASGGTSATLLSTQAEAATRRHHRLGWKREIAWKMMYTRFNWRPRHQFRYLNRLWNRESSWNVHAYNPYSGAYGIPQAVPGSKMSSAGSHWRTSARTQIRWGMRYIKSRYGSPRRAWAHSCATGWY